MISKLVKRHMKKVNNSGSTMLIVMVTIALIGVLATVLMSMSYMNYNMKVTEMNSKKNFYSAEVVLDQIHAGLQKEISDSLEDAYITSMQRYTLEDDTKRNTEFANTYIRELTLRLRKASLDSEYQIDPIDTDGDGVYDCGLIHYLDSALQAAWANGNLVIGSDESKMEAVASSVPDPTAPGGVRYEATGLVLYDLEIQYTDANGFTSVIVTDIRLKTPTLTLITKTAMPNVFDYSLVADQGIEGGTTGVVATFKGNVYAGADTPVDPTTGLKSDPGGIKCFSTHKWNFEDESRIVSAGPIMVGSGATVTVGENSSCWADDLVMSKYEFASDAMASLNNIMGGSGNTGSGGTLNIKGNAYIKDDLTIEGNNANVTLEGNYYGFGDGSTAQDSSAIILNGKNSKLDMTALERLMLGGNAYVQTSRVSYDVSAAQTYNTYDILTGNSLAVKSDQIVYLVPAECVGVNGNEVKVGKNPMNKKEYDAWMEYESKRISGDANYANYQLVSLTKDTDVLGKAIGEYDLNSTTGYKTVFRTINGDTLCYLYLDLTQNGAANYYKDYYYKAETRMNRYITTYKNQILMDLSSMSNMSSRGTILTYSEEAGNISLLQNTINETTTADELDAIQDEYFEYGERFKRMKAKLTTEESEVSVTEIDKTVYENVINTTVMDGLAENTPVEEEYSVDSTKAVFINNRNYGPYEYDDEDICIIVATGDVVLKKNFSGLLITDGKVYIESGVNQIEPNKTEVLRVLRRRESDGHGNEIPQAPDALSLMTKYFRNGNLYSMDTKLSGDVTNSMSGQTMGDLIVFENWAKQ